MSYNLFFAIILVISLVLLHYYLNFIQKMKAVEATDKSASSKKAIIYISALLTNFFFLPYLLINSSQFVKIVEPENFKFYIILYMTLNGVFILAKAYFLEKKVLSS